MAWYEYQVLGTDNVWRIEGVMSDRQKAVGLAEYWEMLNLGTRVMGPEGVVWVNALDADKDWPEERPASFETVIRPRHGSVWHNSFPSFAEAHESLRDFIDWGCHCHINAGGWMVWKSWRLKWPYTPQPANWRQEGF